MSPSKKHTVHQPLGGGWFGPEEWRLFQVATPSTTPTHTWDNVSSPLLSLQCPPFPNFCSYLSGVCKAGVGCGYWGVARALMGMHAVETRLPHPPILSTQPKDSSINRTFLTTLAILIICFFEFLWHCYFYLSSGLSNVALEYYLPFWSKCSKFS